MSYRGLKAVTKNTNSKLYKMCGGGKRQVPDTLITDQFLNRNWEAQQESLKIHVSSKLSAKWKKKKKTVKHVKH